MVESFVARVQWEQCITSITGRVAEERKNRGGGREGRREKRRQTAEKTILSSNEESAIPG